MPGHPGSPRRTVMLPTVMLPPTSAGQETKLRGEGALWKLAEPQTPNTEVMSRGSPQKVTKVSKL